MAATTATAVTVLLPLSSPAKAQTSSAKPLPNASASYDLFAAKADSFLVEKMRSRKTTGWVSLIVRFTGTPTTAQKDVIRGLGGDIYRDLPIIQSVAVRVPRRNLRAVAAQSFVARLSTDTSVQKNDEFAVQASGADTASLLYNATGEGVTVAVVDSGVAFHPDLNDPVTGKTRIITRRDFLPDVRGNGDNCGHGTHVAGIVAGNGSSSTGLLYSRTFYGIARKSKLVSLRVLDSNGSGTVSNVVAAIQWAVANRAAFNIRVLNLSLGHPVGESYKTDPLCQAVETAWKSGIVVVCAAGNAGRLLSSPSTIADNSGYGTAYGTIQSPANDPYVITVGATKSVDGVRLNDVAASYSSRGPSRLDYVMKPDLVAPGNRVISLYTTGGALFEYGSLNGYGVPMSSYKIGGSNDFSTSYFRLSGTSMAAPVVSGAVAMMLQKNPSLTPDTVKARLMISADNWTGPNGTTDPFTYGAGYLNIPAALASSAKTTRFAVSPTVTLRPNGSVWLNGSQIIMAPGEGAWGTNVVNPTQVIWGGGGDVPATSDPLDPALTLLGLEATPALQGAWGDSSVWLESFSGVDLSYTVLFGEN